MLNNNIFNNYKIFQNKYFLMLCFYKKKIQNNNYIFNSLFTGYKYHYLFLNINIFIKMFKNILNLVKEISINNGDILFLYTKNKILNYILQINCLKLKTYYLDNFAQKQANVLKYLKSFPDLIISFDYQTNAIFLNKLVKYNVPTICFVDTLNKNIVDNMIYYLLINNNSIYANILIIYLIFNNIYRFKEKLGTQYFIN